MKWALFSALVVAGLACSGSKFLSWAPSYNTTSIIANPHDVASNDDGSLKLFDDNNRYVLEDYDAKPTFSSFLPAVAGVYGKPVWSFYINRGQAIASFGIKSKDYPILEFNAANKAYELWYRGKFDRSCSYLYFTAITSFLIATFLVYITGFRTFIKGERSGKPFLFEPFNPVNTRDLESGKDQSNLPKRLMFVGTNECEIREMDPVSQLTTAVRYIVLPEETFGALVRRTNITNTGSTPVTISVLDGLAKIEPVGGMLDWALKQMGRTLEGWMGVYQAGEGTTMPFYRMSTEPGDSASVTIELAGHYLLSFIESDDSTLLPIVYDSESIFGRDTSLLEPNGLKERDVVDILSKPQYGQARTSSAFAAVEKITIAPGESITIASFYGRANHIEDVQPIADHVTKRGYVGNQFENARKMMDTLTSSVETNTTSHLFDGAVKQMFLDNSLRGGMPLILGDIDPETKYLNYDEDPRIKVFHVFSRIHGDLERDYNAFYIDDTYFSQGHGNYRDVAQNRRDDVTFTPRVGSFDVQMFLSFIQADAYEPLTVEAVMYYIEDTNVAAAIASTNTKDPKSAEVLTNVLNGGPFRPGQLFALIEQLGIEISSTKEYFIDQVVSAAKDIPMATFGQGYWGDHWDYYLDLINSYLAIYPDGEEKLMYDTHLRYFFSTATVKPRKEKYVLTLTFDGKGKHVLQLDSCTYDLGKEAEQEKFRSETSGILSFDAYWQRTPNGGEAFQSSAIAKLFLLCSIKFATRDAYGMGIEYEGGRPGWNDAMNGLPGMVGSGMPETFELYQMLKYVKSVVDKYQRSVVIPAELGDMISTVNQALDTLALSGIKVPNMPTVDVPKELFTYWDTVATARESYRAAVDKYFSGETLELSASDVSAMIERWMGEIEIGIARAIKIGSRGDGDDG